MQSLQTLSTLHQQAQEQRDAAQREAQLAAQAHQNAQAQLTQLVQYRSEHEARWTTQFRQAGEVTLLHCYHGFNGRLSQAVEQQEQVVAHALARHQALLARLREQELRVASVGKLIERRQAEHRLVQDRRDAKHNDELAARMQRMRHASGY